jgi:hypothetical protein
MRRKLLWTALFGTVVIVTGCGGGGGGGSGGSPYNSPNPYLRTEVPYSTPVRAGTVDPLVNNSYKYFVGDTYAASISGSGQDVIIAGHMTQQSNTSDWNNTRLSLFSWQNGQLTDRTAQWFPAESNVVLGTNTVKFADWFNTGRTGMLVAPYTDNADLTGPAYIYTNNGSSFSRQTINLNNVSSHDSAVYDLNRDGYTDFLVLDTGGNTTLGINNRVNGFTTYTKAEGSSPSGSGVAVADFLGNGTATILTTDSGPSGTIQQSTKLWGFNIDANNQLTFNQLSVLPAPRFELPKWAALGITTSHNVRALAFDFDSSGRIGAVIFSQPGIVPAGVSSNYSEIQFLKNQGGGVFTDVTDTTLVGYNTNTRTTYNPKLIDLNGDGLLDILVSGGDNSGASSQFLLRSSDNKYVATYANILTDYLRQVKSMAGGDSDNHTVNVVQAPDGKLYLVSAVSFMNGSDRQLAVYMSALGSQNVTTAQTAINLMLQKWPYMTAAQANDALARTVATYMNGVGLIDDDAIFRPIGSLAVPTLGGLKPINGYLAGINLGDGTVMALDQAGRSYSMNLTPMNLNRLNAFGYNTEHNDQYELTSHAEYLVNGALTTVNGMRVGTDYAGRDNTGMGLNKPTQYTLGVPGWYRKGAWSVGTQYTYLNTNPWIAFGGAWGEVTGSGIMDNVVSYRKSGFSVQASAMYVSTNITPGLITRVNNMWGAWAETGYRFGDAKRAGDLGIFAGVKPVILSGSVEARIPTAVDMSGNVLYTNKKLMVQNQTTGYVRALYTNQVNRRTQLRLSAVGTTDGQYRAMTELKFWID